MNSDKQLDTTAIYFLPNLYLKPGIGWVYVMVDCICMGLLQLHGERSEGYKMKNSCP